MLDTYRPRFCTIARIEITPRNKKQKGGIKKALNDSIKTIIDTIANEDKIGNNESTVIYTITVTLDRGIQFTTEPCKPFSSNNDV